MSEPFLAARMSQHFVEGRLSTPPAAQFQNVYQAKIEDLGDGVYTVISYVDLHKLSGGPSRVRYLCKLRKTGDGTWN